MLYFLKNLQKSKNTYNFVMQKIIEKILFSLSENKNITSKEDFHRLKNEILAEYKIAK